MLSQIINSPYYLAAAIFLALGTILIFTGGIALFRAHVGSFLTQGIIALLFITTGALLGSIALGIQGYQTFTREEIAANVTISPIAPQRFTAILHHKDGRIEKFIISGDELYIDAHILKWQPLANLIGLHTAYELDRIGGRYRDIEQERTAERSLYLISQNKTVNLFSLRQRYTFLALLLDAKYGSATFIPATQATEYQLRVSTTGLLMREINEEPKLN
jgi:hypothetical protein